MDFGAALTALARVLRPGGRLAVVGLAANGSVSDYLAGAPGPPVDRFYRAIYRGKRAGGSHEGPRDQPGPRSVRPLAGCFLARRDRRHLLWRCPLPVHRR